jgi:hypothetical protein
MSKVFINNQPSIPDDLPDPFGEGESGCCRCGEEGTALVEQQAGLMCFDCTARSASEEYINFSITCIASRLRDMFPDKEDEECRDEAWSWIHFSVKARWENEKGCDE